VKIRPAGVPAPKDKPRNGYVALQSHSDRVEFRKAQIRELVIHGKVMTRVPFSQNSPSLNLLSARARHGSRSPIPRRSRFVQSAQHDLLAYLSLYQ
jgi:hypothetical protein